MQKGIDLSHAETPMPAVSEKWRGIDEAARLADVQCTLDRYLLFAPIQPIAAKANGQVIISLGMALPAASRGPLLMAAERWLREQLDPGITIWLEPKGDRNALRLLRGH